MTVLIERWIEVLIGCSSILKWDYLGGFQWRVGHFSTWHKVPLKGRRGPSKQGQNSVGKEQKSCLPYLTNDVCAMYEQPLKKSRRCMKMWEIHGNGRKCNTSLGVKCISKLPIVCVVLLMHLHVSRWHRVASKPLVAPLSRPDMRVFTLAGAEDVGNSAEKERQPWPKRRPRHIQLDEDGLRKWNWPEQWQERSFSRNKSLGVWGKGLFAEKLKSLPHIEGMIVL